MLLYRINDSGCFFDWLPKCILQNNGDVWKHKRDILVSRVASARDAQEAAKEQFQSALEKFTSVVNVPSSKLQDKYYQLKK